MRVLLEIQTSLHQFQTKNIQEVEMKQEIPDDPSLSAAWAAIERLGDDKDPDLLAAEQQIDK